MSAEPRRALITGIAGQDGTYLSKLLLDKGYEVYGAARYSAEHTTASHHALGIGGQVKFVTLELLEFSNILKVIDAVRPHEIYNLGAKSSVAQSFEQPMFTAEVTGHGALRLLEAIREIDPSIRFYQASSSEMFGKARQSPQTELTPFHPRSPYAVAKLFAHYMTINYREAYGMYACSGILFNHESILRGPQFVTRKITRAAARISLGLQDSLQLGNLDAHRDWGYAPEYVEAMWLMLQQDVADDYVIASGKTHSVRDFVDAAFSAVGIALQWRGTGVDAVGSDAAGRPLVSVNPEFFRPADVDVVVGDASKAREKLGWQPRTSFTQIVSLMVEHDLSEARREVAPQS